MGYLRAISIAVLILLASFQLTHAQEPITATHMAELLSDMPRRVLFSTQATSTAGDITEARIFYQPVGSSARISEPVPVVSPAASATLEHTWELQRNGLPPGIEISYFWRLTDSTGNTFETPIQTYVPLDPRFDWQTIEDEELAISWYDGDEGWGQEMFDTGKAALAQLEEELGADVTSQVRLLAYGSGDEFRDSFPPQQDWIGGQAFPDFGVTVQIIGDGESGWMETVLFHELSHLVFAQATEGALMNPPSWLDEGLAMYNEPGEGRGSAGAVREAAENDELLPFSRLQGNFGADGRLVGIAYAESEMIVTYLINDCGRDGFQEIVDNLVADMTVDEAMIAACGYDSQTLFTTWRATLPNAPEPAPANEGNEQAPTAPQVEEDTTDPAEVREQRDSTIFVVLGAIACLFVGILSVAILYVLYRLTRPRMA